MTGWLLQILALTVWLLVLGAVFVPLERLFAARSSPVLRKQWGIDLIWYFIDGIAPTLMLVPVLALIAVLTRQLDPLQPWYAAVAALPVLVKLPLALLINDFGSYWMHRLSHRSAYLWRFHAVHHSAETVDWLTNSRAHPVDMVVTRLLGLTMVYLVGLGQPGQGATDPVVLAVTLWGTVWSFFVHANVRWRLGPLKWLVATPAFHHWHHSNDEHRDHNFAAIFPFIDKLFGTYWLPAALPTVYGIDGRVDPNLLNQLIDPLLGPVKAGAQPAA